jgi:hypothetical protein
MRPVNDGSRSRLRRILLPAVLVTAVIGGSAAIPMIANAGERPAVVQKAANGAANANANKNARRGQAQNAQKVQANLAAAKKNLAAKRATAKNSIAAAQAARKAAIAARKLAAANKNNAAAQQDAVAKTKAANAAVVKARADIKAFQLARNQAIKAAASARGAQKRVR